jgi:hypothetical protein
MQESDKKQFWLMMNVCMELTNHPPLSKEAIVVWYERLRMYDFMAVSNAVDTWLKESSRPPTPKDVVELCKPKPVIHQRLNSPFRIEEGREKAKQLKEFLKGLNEPL